jgi:outer membrane receptor protein involved in Fe transport
MAVIARPVLTLPVALACAGALAHAQDTQGQPMPRVDVIGTAPLPGLQTPLAAVPADVQMFKDKAIERQQQDNLAAFLAQNAGGVTLGDAQGNPYQPDLNFRGFTASPLLGVPQGLSVFQDGVRVNEPFGDAVNWDLIPTAAIAAIELVPGSNPVYGLNTLGGALAVTTKNGRSHPGTSTRLTMGSYGRRGLQFEHGASRGNIDTYVTANLENDDGWALHNPSRLRQLFARVGWRRGDLHVDTTLGAADNHFGGAQTVPLSFPDQIRQGYTYPDLNENKVLALASTASHALGDRAWLAANLYYRRYRNDNLSSNVNGEYGQPDDAGNIDLVQAFNEKATARAHGFGAALQFTRIDDFADRANQLVLGVSLDNGDTAYTQDSQPAAFALDRGAVGTGPYARTTDAATRTRYTGLYLTDTLALARRWSLTVSGRLNHAAIDIRDVSGGDPRLDGSHRFTRFNQALGLNYKPRAGLTAYAGYNEGMRTPTAMELTCADAEAPCKLPNAFLSDPPLKEVVAKTFEAGARGRHGRTSWNFAAWRTLLSDDIAFVSSGSVASSTGYFHNAGSTRRQGIEVSARTQWRVLGHQLDLDADYALVDATYQSAFDVRSPLNTSADDDGNIRVRRGDAMPGIARHSLKLRADYEPGAGWEFGAGLVAVGNAFARGDENNLDARGKVPGHALLNLDMQRDLGAGWELAARIDNVFDRTYATFGVLGANAFTGPGRGFAGDNPVGDQFRGYGMPRSLVVNLRYRWR